MNASISEIPLSSSVNFARNLDVLLRRDANLARQLQVSHARLAVSQVPPSDIAAEAQACLKLSPLKFPRLLVFAGLGTGDVCQHLFPRLPDSVKEILIVERDLNQLRLALENHDFSVILSDERVTLLAGCPEDRLLNWFSAYYTARERLTLTGRIEHIYLRSALKRDGSYFQSVALAMKEAVERTKEMFIFPPEDAFRGFVNIVDNIDRLAGAPLAEGFENLFQGKTGVVVASGPSLRFHLEALKLHQERCVIACCDGSYRTLIQHGIVPHFVFCLERVVNTARYFDPKFAPFNVPLVTLPLAHPEVLRRHPGNLILMNRGASFGEWLFPGSRQFYMGSSVAHMAYAFLTLTGCQQIALIGQDLAYDAQTMDSHVGEVPQDIKTYMGAMTSGPYAAQVRANNGGTIPSNGYWKIMIDQYGLLLESSRIKTLNVIPEAFGALIPGCERMDPDNFWKGAIGLQAEDLKLREQIARHLRECPQRAPARENIHSIWTSALHYLSGMLPATLALMNAIGREYNDRLPVANGQATLDEFKTVIAAWDQACVDLLNRDGEMYMFLPNLFLCSTYFQIRSKRMEYPWDPQDACNTVAKHFDWIQEWLAALHQWCGRIANVLEQGLNKKGH